MLQFLKTVCFEFVPSDVHTCSEFLTSGGHTCSEFTSGGFVVSLAYRSEAADLHREYYGS